MMGCGVGEKDDEDYLECTRGAASGSTMARILGVILGVSLLCLFTLFASITCHVYVIERTLSTPTSTLRRRDGDGQQGNYQEEFEEQGTDQEYITRIRLSVPSFRNDHFEVILWSTSTLLPVFGIFLILIYTRPKVQILQKMFPKASWRLCFSVVVTSGGEVPPTHELKPSIHLLSQLSEVDSQEYALSNGDSSSNNGVYYEGLRKSMIAASRQEGWYELQK